MGHGSNVNNADSGWLILSFVVCLFLVQLYLNESGTSTKRKTELPSITLSTIAVDSDLLCLDIPPQTKALK